MKVPRTLPSRISICAVLVISSLFAAKASADFLYGKTLNLSIAHPTTDFILNDSGPFVVGDGQEVSILNQFGLADVVVDFQDTKIVFLYTKSDQFASGQFNGWIITDLSGDLDTFAGFQIDPSNTLSGFGPERLFYDEHSLYLNVTGLFVSAGNQLVVSVPEASSAILCSTGVIGLLLIAGRRYLTPRS